MPYNGVMETIRLQNVVKTFNGTRAIDHVSLSVPAGTIFGLLGPNGAGKTTTIRMLVDVYRPDEGKIRIFGENPGLEIQHRIGYLPEERGLYRKMKVVDQLVFLGELKNVPPRRARRRAMKYLEKYDLREWAFKKVEQLSKGMQQKVQFIGTLLHDPDLLILDEPFSGLDPVNQALLKEEIQAFVREGKTVVFSTHVLPQAEQLCRYICLINRGKNVLEGNLEAVKKNFMEPVSILETEADLADLRMEKVEIKKEKDHYEIRCPEAAHVERYLLHLLQKGVPVRSFRPKETDLETIFIKVVSGES